MTQNLQPNNINRRMQQAPVRPAIQQDTSITPKEILGIIRRHLIMIVVFTFLGTVLGGGGWFILKTKSPKYTANTAIEVQSPLQNDPLGFANSMPAKEILYQFRYTKASFMMQQSFLQDLLKIDEIKKTKWYAQFDNSIKDAVANLEDNLSVSPQRDSDWITVSMTCSDPIESASIVNAAAKSFVTKQLNIARKDTADQLAQREEQRKKIKSELDSLEAELLRKVRDNAYGTLEPTTFRNYLDETLADSLNNRNLIDSQIAQMEANIELLKKRLDYDFDDTVQEEIERDRIAMDIRNRITMMEQELASQLSRFGERHRQVQELRDAIGQLNKDLDNRKIMIGDIVRRSRLIAIEDEMIASTKMRQTLEDQRQAAQEQYRDLSVLKAEYATLAQQKEEKQKTLEEINNNIEKFTAIYNDPELSKVKQVFEAVAPLQMSSPKLMIFGPGGFILGAMLGFGLAFLKELSNEFLRSPSDVVKYLRVPLLTAVCHSNEDAELKGVDTYHAVRQAPFSITSECYRQLKTNLRHSNSGTENKVIFVTSPSISGGKSTVAANLAATFVAEGLKVLFIDTHFRNPVSLTAYPHTNADGSVVDNNGKGLSNYLLAQYELDEIIRESGIDGLKVIDCGPMPSTSAEILGNARMSVLLEKAAHDFDYVIIDGPGLLVASAKILAAQADGTILVCNSETTKRGEANRTLRELKEINANVVGAVLVAVKAMKGGYFHERYKTYRKYHKKQIAATV